MNAANPGLVKVMGGFVFPVGLVMWVPSNVQSLRSIRVGDNLGPHVVKLLLTAVLNHRIVLGGWELLTSNMMVSIL